ncbi:MAG: PhnD/SsuA/transferrin family substrate-binding protein [Duodenibacillus sp.]|nr:PhnD/SsuA/transferrin family substrate-binding protein [Duodenibacillus sp.]
MFFLKWCICLVLAFVGTIREVPATVWGKTSEPAVRIAALDVPDLEEISSQQAILLDRLRRDLHPRQIVLKYYSADDLIRVVRQGGVEFVIADALFFASIEHELSFRYLAGLVYPEAVDADHMTASTVFVKRSAKRLSWDDIKGKKAWLLDANSFGGWVALRAYLGRRGLPQGVFDAQPVEGRDAWSLIKEVQRSDDVVGILPACSLERLGEQGLVDLQALTVIDEKKGAGLDCRRTTDMYPGWILASMPATDIQLVRRITSTALISNSTGELQWSFPPSDLRKVHDVLLDLNLEPYAKNQERFWQQFFDRFKWWILLGVLIVIALVFHSFIVACLVRSRTRDLHNAMIERQRMTEEMIQARARLQRMEKIQAVSLLSTIIAHELKQPLGAIRNFSLGLMRRSEQNELDPRTLQLVTNKIIDLTDNASKIVTMVRSYAKSGQIERTVENLGDVVRTALQTHATTQEKGPAISLVMPDELIRIEICVREIELSLLNLLKNAVEATREEPKPKIVVTVRRVEHHAIISVTDNGKGIRAESLEAVFKPLHSSNPARLGLGLAIVQSVAESHGGRINAVPNADKGVTMEMVLPLLKDKKE